MKAVVFILLYLADLIAADSVESHPHWNLLNHEDCGESISDRIIGGMHAGLGQFPWMVQLGYKKIMSPEKPPSFKCGGSLINKLYVLTAAHCIVQLKSEVLVKIRLGENDARSDVDCEEDVCAPPVQDFKPAKLIYHEKYQQPSMRNDIALIRLDKPALFNQYVLPICLPRGPLLTKDHTGTVAEVAGWGISNIHLPTTTSPILLHVRLPLVRLSQCENVLGTETDIGEGQLCAGGKVGFDSCGGDSGGPLMKPEAVDRPPQYFIIGLVSYGSMWCGNDVPAIYTDVAKYMTWILDHMAP